jgi:hypothetical protein
MFRRGMGQKDRQSRRREQLTVCVLAAAIAALSVASSASAAPAVDEYNSRLPSTTGDEAVGPTAPQSHPEQLPAAVGRKLDKVPKGRALAAIATSDALKAPQGTDGEFDDDSTSGRGILAAGLSALGDPLGIAVLLGLAGITAGAVLLRRSSGGAGPLGPSR